VTRAGRHSLAVVQRVRAIGLRRALDGVIPVVLGASVVGFVLGSSWSLTLVRYANHGRWFALAALFCLAVLWAGLERRWVMLPLYYGAAALLLLALVSRFWSVRPRLTDGRASSLVLLFLTSALLSVGVAGRTGSARRLLLGILAAADAVALAGLAALLVSPHSAHIGSTLSAFRLQGIGQNPNTVPMLAAIALPIAAGFWWRPSTRLGRTLAIASCALLVPTIVLSQSDGALLAGAVGIGAFGLLAQPGRLRRVTTAAIAAAALAGVALVLLLPPATRRGALDSSYPNVNYAHIPADYELGWPSLGGSESKRVIFTSSGRVDGWRAAVLQAGQRPLLGYGFGTEDKVFVDRTYSFRSSRAENSYIGLYLQLGVAGVATLAAVIVLLAASSRRGLRTVDPDRRWAVVVTTGVVLAGLTVAVVQSYLYSVGNVATLPFWVCCFLLARIAVDPAPVPGRNLITPSPSAGRERVAVS
jgi:O-antigen ligase